MSISFDILKIPNLLNFWCFRGTVSKLAFCDSVLQCMDSLLFHCQHSDVNILKSAQSNQYSPVHRVALRCM